MLEQDNLRHLCYRTCWSSATIVIIIRWTDTQSSLTVEVGYGEMLSWWCWLWDHSLSGHSDIYILTSSKWSHLTVVRSHSFQLASWNIAARITNSCRVQRSVINAHARAHISRPHPVRIFGNTFLSRSQTIFRHAHKMVWAWDSESNSDGCVATLIINCVDRGSGQGEVREFCIVGAGPGGTQYDNKKF